MHDQGKRCPLELISVLDSTCHWVAETCVDWGDFLSHRNLLVGSHEFLSTGLCFWRCWKHLYVALSFTFLGLVRGPLGSTGRLNALVLDSEAN